MGMYTNLKAGRKLEVWIKKEFILKTLPSMYKNTTCSSECFPLLFRTPPDAPTAPPNSSPMLLMLLESVQYCTIKSNEIKS